MSLTAIRAADLLGRLFVNDWESSAFQTASGGVQPISRPITSHWLRRHVEGEWTIMTNSPAAKEGTRWLCLQVTDDSVNGDMVGVRNTVTRLRASCTHYQLPVAVEWAGAHSYRLWALLSGHAPATLVHSLGERLLQLMDEELPLRGSVVIHPSQRPGLESLVCLPWGIHRLTGERCCFCDVHLRPHGSGSRHLLPAQVSFLEGLPRARADDVRSIVEELGPTKVSPPASAPASACEEDRGETQLRLL